MPNDMTPYFITDATEIIYRSPSLTAPQVLQRLWELAHRESQRDLCEAASCQDEAVFCPEHSDQEGFCLRCGEPAELCEDCGSEEKSKLLQAFATPVAAHPQEVM